MAFKDILNSLNKEEEPIMSKMTSPTPIEDYSKAMSQDPVLFQTANPPEDYMQKALEEANDNSMDIAPQMQTLNAPSINNTDSKPLIPAQETDLQKLESKLQELRDLDAVRQSTASKYNFGAKAAGILGDAISKYQAGAIQKNVGVPIQHTGPTLQQLMGIIGEVKPPSNAEQRKALIDRYKELKAEQKEAGATQREKDAADLKYKRDLEMLGIKTKSDEKIAFRKAAEPTFEEKLNLKAKADEDKAIAKENRETKKQLDPAISSLDSQIKYVDKALNLLVNPKTGLPKSDLTGPWDQYKASFSKEGQALKDALSNIALTKMTQMFAGMSKTIDSDAERAFFQAAQPSLEKYEDVNVDVLKEMKANLESLREKSKVKLQEIEGSKQNQPPYGEFTEMDGKSYRWNPAVNKYQLIPSK